MRVLPVLGLCAVSGFALAAESQGDLRPLDQLMAGAIVDLIVPDSHASWGYSWTSTGVRARDIHWHLAEPDENPADRTTYQRTGWMGARGESARVIVCGTAERVTTITFNGTGSIRNQDYVPNLGLPEALRASGVNLVESDRTPVSVDYEVRPEGRVPARLRIHGGCTSPYARSAQRCWTDYTLVLDIDASDDEMVAAQMCGGREDQR